MTRTDRILDRVFALVEFACFCECCYVLHYWWSITPP